MKAAVVAIGRRENQYAREFVEHHLALGFSTIIICDNNRGEEEHFEEVLGPYVESGQVIIMDYRDRDAVQVKAYSEIYLQFGPQFDWLAFFDFDEHLHLAEGVTLEQLLTRDTDAILVNWKCYGDNGLVKKDPRPLEDRFTRPLPQDLCVQYRWPENRHIKSIVRGKKNLQGLLFTRNPHIPNVPRLESPSGRQLPSSPFQDYEERVAVLHHYITKTAEEWAEKWRKGTGARPLSGFHTAYGSRFFKYNKRTPEKEAMLKDTQKTVAIVHYNTPELLEAAIKSLRKHGGEDYQVVVFDNSDRRPFTKRMKGVKRINNTKGQIINWNKFLAEYPDKETKHGEINDWGSAKHARTVQELWKIIPQGFLLMDSDVLIQKNIDFMFDERECTVGHVQHPQPYNPFGTPRLLPMLLWINVPMCEAGGAKFFDPNRSWHLQKGLNNPANWYDTGASFLEDIKTLKPQCHGKRIDIRPLIVHFGKGSWLRNDVQVQKAWLKTYRHLWE